MIFHNTSKTEVFKAGRIFNSSKGTYTENCVCIYVYIYSPVAGGFAVSSQSKKIVGNLKWREPKT